MYSKSLLRSALEAALVIFAVAWLLDRAWELVEPLLPVILAAIVTAAVLRAISRRRNYW